VEYDRTMATKAKAGDTLPFKTVIKALGVRPDVFRKEVRCHPEFIGSMRAWVVEWGRVSGSTPSPW